MKQILTVMRFEFLSFAKSGTFIGMSILLMLLALIGPAIPMVIGMFSDTDFFGSDRSIAVVDHTGQFDADIIESYLASSAVFFTDLDEAKAAVVHGLHEYVLEISDDIYTIFVDTMGIGVLTLQGSVNHMIQSQYRTQHLYGLGIPAAVLDDIFAFQPEGNVAVIGAAVEGVEDTGDALFAYLENMVYSYVLGIVLYISLLIGGTYLLTTVIREKSTKTMELLITSCKAIHMLNGKVLGVSSAILVQILTVVVGLLVSMSVTATLGGGIDIPFEVSVQTDILIFLVIFFLLGFIMYSYIYAALASTVSRMEDANSIALLPTLLIMVGFMGSIFGMNDPGAGWVIALSHVPIFAPFVMFMRICLGTAAGWEIALSIAAQIFSMAAISWVGSKIYRMGTLMYGNKPKLKDFISAFRMD